MYSIDEEEDMAIHVARLQGPGECSNSNGDVVDEGRAKLSVNDVVEVAASIGDAGGRPSTLDCTGRSRRSSYASEEKLLPPPPPGLRVLRPADLEGVRRTASIRQPRIHNGRVAKSPYIGVRQRNATFSAEIASPENAKRLWLGSFRSKEMAALAYDYKALTFHGDGFLATNFIHPCQEERIRKDKRTNLDAVKRANPRANQEADQAEALEEEQHKDLQPDPQQQPAASNTPLPSAHELNELIQDMEKHVEQSDKLLKLLRGGLMGKLLAVSRARSQQHQAWTSQVPSTGQGPSTSPRSIQS